jgi:aspartyl-tRNA(Asn)/glutamyl-tRNA(Gln) amidotransferase subunit B
VFDYFEDAARRCGDAKAAANWVTNQVLATLKEQKIDIGAFPLTPERLAELIAEQKGGLSKQKAGEVYSRMLQTGSSAKEAMVQLGIQAVSDTGQLAEIVRGALADNARAVADYKNGKAAALNSLKGAVMKKTRGMANPEVVQKILLEELQKV